MRIGVYNLYWPTLGGGEQQAGGIVDALSSGHEVELLGPAGFELGRARERLGLRLDGVTYREVNGDEYSATLASGEYDLFVNHTYRSVAPNRAAKAIYFVMFPHDLDATRPVARVARRLGGRFAAPVRMLRGVAWHQGAPRIVGTVLVQIEPGVGQVEIDVTSVRPEQLRIASVHPTGAIEQVSLPAGATVLRLPAGSQAVVIEPSVMLEELDADHAIVVKEIRADGVRVTSSPSALAQRLAPVRTRDFIPTYTRFVSLSEYTRTWTQRWWGTDSEVISPPVQLREGGTKEPLIVSVGRFFGEGSGHSKRQLEMVHAFRRMVEGGLTGWKLVLIGGCSPEHREYAMAVRRAAEGLPVEVRLSAPGAVLDDHLARASVYWHAAGYGSDLDHHPERAEHFGIAPIEAMSAGAVPVVFGAAGPAEVVHDGVDGLVFRTIDELVAATRSLTDDPTRRARLAEAAVQSARHYRRERFEDEVRSLVQRVAAE